MKKLVFIFMLLLIPCGVFANAYVSQQNGLWSRASNFADSPWFDGGAQSVWASWPQATDTFDIVPGHTVTIDGDITVGDTAVNDTTYDNVIQGNLVWPANPGADWTFKTSSSILINGVGKFYIGCAPATPATRLNCANTAIVEFQTGLGIKYDIKIAGNSAQLLARGCEGYPAYNGAVSLGTETRARITACAPNCDAGAARVLTLDTTVNWSTGPTITNPVTGGDAEVLIGSGGSLTPPGGHNSELAVVTDAPAANQVEVTLANDHQVGDIIANPTRNILFKSSNVTNHSSVYSVAPSGTTLSPFMLSWVRFDEMGDTVFTAAGIYIDLDASDSNWGTIEYTWMTHCADTTGVSCMYIKEGAWDSFDWNGVYDCGANGYGVNMVANLADPTVTGFTAIGVGASATAFYTGNTYNKRMYQMWVSDARYGHAGATQEISDSLFHNMYSWGINTSVGHTWSRHIPQIYKGNEFRNIVYNGLTTTAEHSWVIENDFDNCVDSCIFYQLGVQTSTNVYSRDNTFDNCNSDGAGDDEGAVRLYMWTGKYYSTNDSFGISDQNHMNNISIRVVVMNASAERWRFTLNDAVYVAPLVPENEDLLSFYRMEVALDWWRFRVGFDNETYATVHNDNQVEDAHWGYGPGGMTIEHVTGAGPVGGWVDNTANLKITPFAADRYCRVLLGKTHVEAGVTLTVDAQIQKNQAIVTGRRPRLVLKGCGFDWDVDYDEMADVNNTWDAVQVSGVTTAKGLVYAYIEVLNDLGLDNPSYPNTKPVDPATIIIYVDGVDHTKI